MPNDAKNWSSNQLQFMVWLALPKAERKPTTQQKLALEIGVDQATLSDWKRIPGFRDEVNRMAREFVKDDVPEVLGTIRRFAKQGSVPHLNMFLSMAGLAADVEAAGKGTIGIDESREQLSSKLARFASKDES
jgi:hypothetical protein